MLANTSISLINAASKLLRPLVKILLRNGIDYGTFAEVVRKVYVDTAFEYIEEGGKRPTISSVSAMTGLTRKESKRLKELSAPESDITHQRYNRAIRVISGWLNDTRFLDEHNKPAILSFETGNKSFANLVKAYSGDIPPSAMLTVLAASNSVVRDGDHVKLLQHAYIPEDDPIEKIEILGVDTAELIGTIEHNLAAKDGNLFFQRKVSNCLISDESMQEFKKLSAEKSQQLLEQLNVWLGEHEITDTEKEKQSNYVALGIYYSQRSDPNSAIGENHE
jgi:hypothetical protein